MNKLTNLLAGLAVTAIGLIPALAAGAAGNDLIANNSVETANGSAPASWSTLKSGNNTTSFNYLNTGHTGSRSVQVQMTKRSGGQAEWVFAPVAVTANTKYTFSDWYQSNVQTHYAVEVTKTGGKTTDFADSNLAASATWKQGTISFTTPKNATSVTVYHYLDKVGQLTTDDFNLEGPAPVAPTVKLTAPKAGATVKGTQSVTATATTTDAGGVASVQFAVDGFNSGTPDTTSPYSFSWDTTKVTNGNHTITATALGKDGLSGTISEIVNVQNPVVTLPTVTISTPTANAMLSGTQAVTATVTPGSYTVKSVQFQLDSVNLGAAVTKAPYTTSWNTTTSTNAAHNLTAILTTTTTGVGATSATVPVTVNNVTPPVVSITAPGANATLSGTTPVTANATDAQGITSVQFKLGNNNLGSAITTAPYTYNWDTTTVADGAYSLTAVATNKASLSTTSAPVSVTVKNTTSGGGTGNGPNIILNPGLETANGAAPANWLSSNWGTNTSTFTYLSTGHTGSHSVEVQTSKYTDGAANWYYADLPVTAGATYQYSNWYESNVDTEVDAEVTMSDGSLSYYYLGAVPASTSWAKFTTTFTPPAGAKSVAIYQILAKVGYIISDDYSMNTYTPTPLNRGIVTVNFDDGWLSQYTNGVPALKANNLTASFFIITDSSITNPDPQYMNVTQLKALQSDGYEIGNHTETHPDLTTLTTAQVQTEMGGAETALQNALGITATDFAYPFGAYNASTIAIGKQVGFVSQRSVNAGFNTKDNLDLTQLKIEEVDADTTTAQVQAWVNQAIAQKSWLILVYHEIDTVAPAGSGDDAYLTSPTNLNTELSYIKSTGVAVETTAQAINEIQPQL